MSAEGDPQPTMTLTVTFIGAITVLVLVVFAQALFYHLQRVEDEQKTYAATPQELRDLQARQLAQISTYHYLDANAGVVAIPIDEAITAYVNDVQRGFTGVPTTNSATRPSTSPSGEPTP